jgi:hypothetical protein
MSNHYDSVSQSDWQGQYSFLPPGDNNLFSQQYDHVASSTDNNTDSQAQPRSVAAPDSSIDIQPKQEGSPIGHRIDPLGLRASKQQSPVPEQPENQGEQYAAKAEPTHEDSLVPTETPSVPLTSNPLSSVSSTGQGLEAPTSQPTNEGQSVIKDEAEEDVLEDEEMVEGDAEGEAPAQPQTAAERTAQRRKMKRFR